MPEWQLRAIEQPLGRFASMPAVDPLLPLTFVLSGGSNAAVAVIDCGEAYFRSRDFRR
jgi:hypothetical protein